MSLEFIGAFLLGLVALCAIGHAWAIRALGWPALWELWRRLRNPRQTSESERSSLLLLTDFEDDKNARRWAEVAAAVQIDPEITCRRLARARLRRLGGADKPQRLRNWLAHLHAELLIASRDRSREGGCSLDFLSQHSGATQRQRPQGLAIRLPDGPLSHAATLEIASLAHSSIEPSSDDAAAILIERLQSLLAQINDALTASEDRDPDHTRLQRARAVAGLVVGQQTRDQQVLEQTVASLHWLIATQPRAKAPLTWAGLQHDLGVSLAALGELRQGEGLHQQAIAAFKAALEERREGLEPTAAWAESLAHLSAVERLVGARKGDATLLASAVDGYRRVLAGRQQDAGPSAIASMQSDLGAALWQLGGLKGDEALLQEAIDCFRQSLALRDRKTKPMDWAATQNNLANGLATLGERPGHDALLEEAADAYRQALLEWTRDRAPMQWAVTKNNLGNVLRAIGSRRKDPTLWREAAALYQEALKERTRDRVPLQWAATQNNLGHTLQLLGKQRGEEASLDGAIIAFREALKERTRERMPYHWAATQNNLAMALQTLGDRRREEATLTAAIAAYREALKEWTLERVPSDWAGIQNNIGNALRRLAACRSDGDPDSLTAAIGAYRAALQVLNQLKAKDVAAGIAKNLKQAEAELAALKEKSAQA